MSKDNLHYDNLKKEGTKINTKVGGQKMVATIKEKYGVNSEGKSVVHSKGGKKGGAARVRKGFAVTPLPVNGYKSKRGFKFTHETDGYLYYIKNSTGKEVRFKK